MLGYQYWENPKSLQHKIESGVMIITLPHMQKLMLMVVMYVAIETTSWSFKKFRINHLVNNFVNILNPDF